MKKVQDLVLVNTQSPSYTVGHDTQSTKGNRTTAIAKESIQVMKQVGKVVEKNVLTMKEKVILLSKPPPIKEGFQAPEYPDLFRVGFVELRDVRIFTKEIISRGHSGGVVKSINHVVPSSESEEGLKPNLNDAEFGKPIGSNHFAQSKPRKLAFGISNWSKPILLKELKIYHAELCPSSYSVATMLKEKHGNNAQSSLVDNALFVGLPIEQVCNIVMSRILTEIAKTNPNQLLTKAFSEIFTWFDVEA